MTPAQLESSKDDEHTGKIRRRKLNKAELADEIKRVLANPPNNLDRKSAKALQTIAERSGIPLFVEEEKINEGWLGKAKGLEQICWERRLIDGTDRKSYSKKNSYKTSKIGNIINHFWNYL